MALSLWQGPLRLGDVYAHGIVSQPKSGHFGCVLAFLTVRLGGCCPARELELRHGEGERVGIRASTLVRHPGVTIVGEVDGAAPLDGAG